MAVKIKIAAKAPVATVNNVIEFIGAIKKLVATGSSFNVFRGQRNSDWKSAPGIMRASAGLVEHEREITRELIAVHPQEFDHDSGMFDKLVRMQHYGLPTRLLDVSLNPLVSLYFATEPFRSRLKTVDGVVYVYKIPKQRKKYYDSDAVACIANLSNLSAAEREEIVNISHVNVDDFNKNIAVDRLVQFVRSEKSHFRPRIIESDLFLPFYVVPKMSNRRIIVQSGAFIIYGLDRSPSSPRRGSKYPINHEKIIIPQDAKVDIRAELEQLGINESTLFPEIERAASFISKKSY
jgi:hypothetical protein